MKKVTSLASIFTAFLPAVAAVLAGGAFAQGMKDYEVWAIDQGTGVVHVYNSMLEEVGKSISRPTA